MNAERMEALADVLLKKGLTAIEVEEGGVRIRLERGSPAAAVSLEKPAAASPAGGSEAPAEAPAAGQGSADSPPATIREVTSPLVGVVYLAPSPDSEPFVTAGATVEKGQVLCIIDAMKMLNEVTASTGGIVEDICVSNEEVVEYGACLFRIREV